MNEKEICNGLHDHAIQERDRFLQECNRDILSLLGESDRARGDRYLASIRCALHAMIDGDYGRAFETLKGALPENKRRTTK